MTRISRSSSMIDLVGETTAQRLRSLSLTLYTRGAEYAASKGIIIADTKFRVPASMRPGASSGSTKRSPLIPPGSGRWTTTAPAVAQPSFDKQFVRDFLLSIKWDKKPPAPRLPEEIVTTTSRKYEDALIRLTGKGVA